MTTVEKTANLEEILFEGTPLKLGKTVYTLPPLNLNNTIKAVGIINTLDFSAGLSVEMIEKMKDLIHLALGQNYPELDRETIGNFITISKVRDVIEYIVSESDLKQTSSDPNAHRSNLKRK